MRQVAGKLRLDLAQYNELAAFAQFGSDLDRASMDMLKRGQRMVELLKQDQYSPMPVEEQVVVLFAGTRGHLDDVALEKVRAFEAGLVKFMRASYANLMAHIVEKKQLDPELEKRLADAITDFKKKFV